MRISVSAADQTPENSAGSRKTTIAAIPVSPGVMTWIECARITSSAARRYSATAGCPLADVGIKHHVAGFGEGALGQESRHGIAAGEPDWQRRHFEPDVGLQQVGERRQISVFECRAVAVEELATLGVVGLGHVVFARRDLGEMGARSLQRAVDRRRSGLEQLGDLGGAELHDVAQDQHRPLTCGSSCSAVATASRTLCRVLTAASGVNVSGSGSSQWWLPACCVEVDVGVVGPGAQARGQHPAGAVLQRAQARGGGDPVQPGPQRGPLLERRVAAPAAQIRLLDEILGVVHRAEHAVAMRNQLAAKRRRLLDEVLLGRHGRSPISATSPH